MKGFFTNIRSMVRDSHNNTISSKRVIVFLCVIMMIMGFVANVWYGVEVSEHIYTSIMYVIMVGVGATGIEKFAHQSVSTYESSGCCKCCCCNAKNESTAFGEATDGAS